MEPVESSTTAGIYADERRSKKGPAAVAAAN